LKKLILPLAAACFVTACLAAPQAFDLEATVQAAGRGRMGGWTADGLVAWTAGVFGWSAAGLVRSFAGAWLWLPVVFAVLLGLGFLPRRWRWWAAGPIGIGLAAVCGLGIYHGSVAWGNRWTDLRLAAPQGLLQALGGQDGHVFLNPAARAAMAALSPSLVAGSPSALEAAELMRSPARWRAADRESPFSAVVLAGQPGEAAPLIAHLSDSPDWYLAAVDNQGLIFLRGQKPDQLDLRDPGPVAGRERAVFLAQAALNLDAAGAKREASRRMEEALALAGTDYDVLFRAATLAAAQNRWESSRKLAAKALARRAQGFEASYLLAWSLLETRDVDGAFRSTSALARAHPSDVRVLLLHARAARAAKDFARETDSLEALLPLVKNDAPANARIHIYLGQSWAQRGFPRQALENYRRALEGPLTPAEAGDVREAIQTIEDKQPGSRPGP